MSAPRAPRKATGGVDAQLLDFDTDLYNHLTYQLLAKTNMDYWRELDQMSPQNRDEMNRAVDMALLDLTHRYADTPGVLAILEQARILFKNVVWAAMNVPFPNDTQLHIEQVIDNLVEVYNREIYAPLRTEMVMANHHAQVLQRTWRRCITDPNHPACKRRLEYEFKECMLCSTNVLDTA